MSASPAKALRTVAASVSTALAVADMAADIGRYRWIPAAAAAALEAAADLVEGGGVGDAVADVLAEIPGVQPHEARQIGRGVAMARAVIVRMVRP